MAEADGAEGSQDLEAPVDNELDDEYRALLHFGQYNEARRALPREQWTSREKANYYLDRFFLGFLVLFSLVLLGECCYKMWYVTNVKKIAEFVSDSVIFLFDWLLKQERHEELAEL